MTAVDAPSWRDPRWRKQAIRYWLSDPFWGALDYLGHYGLGLLPIPLAQAIGASLGVLAGRFRFKKANERIAHNLSVLRPDLSSEERQRLALENWRNLGRGMVEYSFLHRLRPEGRMVMTHTDVLQPYRRNRVPVIFVFVHTGNWEACDRLGSDFGLDLMCVYKAVRNRFARRLCHAARQRSAKHLKLVDADAPGAMRKIFRHLAQNGALWLAVDEFKDGQVHGPRFGRTWDDPTTNAAFAVRLAQRFGAVLVPVLPKRLAAARWTAALGEPIAVMAGEAAAREARQTLNGVIEPWVLDNLDQWYMLHQLRPW